MFISPGFTSIHYRFVTDVVRDSPQRVQLQGVWRRIALHSSCQVLKKIMLCLRRTISELSKLRLEIHLAVCCSTQ